MDIRFWGTRGSYSRFAGRKILPSGWTACEKRGCRNNSQMRVCHIHELEVRQWDGPAVLSG
jgi:hypothetical protein